MLKHRITKLVEEALSEAQRRGLLPSVTPPAIVVEHPPRPEQGDYASSLPLRLARSAGEPPLSLAEKLASLIPVTPEIEKVEVASPGYINFTLSAGWLARQVDAILEKGDGYGEVDLGKGERVQIEFVSVNPTGPLHVGHGRGAVLGSTLANVLSAAGYSVEREYYLNDTGNQMRAFYESLWTRYRQGLGISASMPQEGYLGAYMVDLAKEVISQKGSLFLEKPEDSAIRELGELGMEEVVASIRKDLERLGVSFDVWFSERSLYQKSQYDRAMALLRDGGHIVEKEGAVWFASTALGENKDNVLVRSNGSPTYFASDVAYHYNKFLERGFDRVINIWGADHQGHVPRMKAVLKALGIASEKLHIIISQMVSLRRGEELVRVSKRSGDIITLSELLDEVGPDACRFFFLSRSAESQMDFDIELAKRRSQDNPVYYVQYAHARICSILRRARDRGLDYRQGDVALLTSEHELTLIRRMLLLPEMVEMVAVNLEPHHLPYYAQELATVFHLFYKHCRVISRNEALTLARLKLVDAARIVLARSLHLMGMSAPEKM